MRNPDRSARTGPDLRGPQLRLALVAEAEDVGVGGHEDDQADEGGGDDFEDGLKDYHFADSRFL